MSYELVLRGQFWYRAAVRLDYVPLTRVNIVRMLNTPHALLCSSVITKNARENP